jgi:Fe2+ transport system protein B
VGQTTAMAESDSEERTITVALAGQPDAGKSTVFNVLTGLSQHVGNWPGKTVKQKTGIYHYDGTRAHIVDSPRARLLTILVAPLVPCKARMAVVRVLTPIFFGQHAALVTRGLIGLSLALLAVTGWLLHESILRRVHGAFIMELPLYHQPNARTIGPYVWQRTTSFVRKASSILAASILVWALSALRGGRFGSTTWRPSGGS